jgi:microcompartment protein CcmK/EutM
MQIGRVVGMVVSTRKESSLDGLRLMLVKQVDEQGKETGAHLVAADAVGSGPEELVLYATGSSARQTTATDRRPVDAVIMAIVDSWTLDGAEKYRKNPAGDHSDYS